MMKDAPKVNELWKYKRTGKLYNIAGLCMIKTHKPNTENGWSKGVIYHAVVVTPLQDSTYVRELDEFLEGFEKYEGP